jgi:D-sedoheptulose 7-phosphate isomerase
MKDMITSQLQEAAKVLNTFLSSEKNLEDIESAARLITGSLKNNHKIISCGNGGSHCDAMHFAEELTGKFRNERGALAAISISDPSHITCAANDYGFEKIFSRYIEGVGQEGDVLFCISTSGNSLNIINAVEAARTNGMNVVALTGKDGGKLASLSDVEIRVPHHGYSDRIQEIHIKIIHIIILLVEELIGK